MQPGDRRDLGTAQAEVDPDLLPPTRDRRSRLGGRARPDVLLAIALGGAAGTPARYAIGRILPTDASGFPWSTFLVNVTGCLFLGAVLTLIIERWPPSRYARPFVAIGFIGAYTTFSTYAVEADLLIKDDHVGVGVAYVGLTLLAGFAAVALGIIVVRRLPVTRGAHQ